MVEELDLGRTDKDAGQGPMFLEGEVWLALSDRAG